MAKPAPKARKAPSKPARRAPAPKMVTAKTGLPTRTKPKPASPSKGRGDATIIFAKAAAKSLEDSKCVDVVVLDLRGRSQITDFFVIGSGTSDRQMHSAAEHVVELGESIKESLYRSNLDEKRANWYVLDFVDVVVHTLMPDARRHYDLEMLWGDAPRVEWKKGGTKVDTTSKRNRAGLKQSDVLPGRKR